MQEYKRLKPYNVGFITDKIVGLVTVDRPVTETNIIEASKVGLTILSRSTDPNKSLYRYNKCGHTEFLQPTHVRRNNFKCSTCLRVKEINSAWAAGSLFLFKTKGVYRRYLRSCGHTIDSTAVSAALYKEIKCVPCFNAKLNQVAEKNGYKILSYLKNAKRLIGFRDCQHTKEVHHAQIQKGNIVCRECAVDLHIKTVRDQELVYLRNISSDVNGRYNLYLLPCGHEKLLREDHAEEGVYLCGLCGDSHYTKPSNVYLTRFTLGEFSWLKFGFARNIKIRSNSYGTPTDAEKEILRIVPFRDGYSAMKFEKSIHRKYKSLRYPKTKMIDYHCFNGFTECYPISALTALQEELDHISNDI